MITILITFFGVSTTETVPDRPINRRQAADLLIRVAQAGGKGSWHREGCEPIKVG
jgi:hypothetical protein